MRSTSDCIWRECLRNGLPELLESRFRLRKKSPSVIATARNTRAPITVPAMAAIDVPLAGSPVEVGEEVEEVEEVGVVFVVWVEGVDVLVAVVAVEDGESPLRHVTSSVIPTVLTSEQPPFRP